ncbi:MAG: hypoxanthine-guanine phosphoribosyltransferase [Gammaproteobacteria bacterium]|nr:hypoxanthine-guanine phosphoribosyltransferase [Gammaproteobacteria bacterium]
MTPGEILAVSRRAICLHTEAEVEDAIDLLAAKVSTALRDRNPLLLCLMNGGLVFAGKLLTRLDFPLQIDYLHATRYRNNTQGSELNWHRLPMLSLDGRDVLIIDDILDEGETLAAVVEHCRAQRAASVLTAVLVDKLHERKVADICADFIGLRVEDRYLYGYGMDYRGYLRNAAGIYAVDPVDCD